MNKKLGYILITIFLFFPTYVLAQVMDINDMAMAVEFLDSLNNQNPSKALSYLIDSEEKDAEMLVNILKLHTDVFGKIEIIDISDPQKSKEACGTDRCLSNFSLGTKYYENQSNPVVFTIYKVKYEKAGQGFLQIFYPGDEKTGKITEAKIAYVTFNALKEGNFTQFLKFTSDLKKLSENKNDVSNP